MAKELTNTMCHKQMLLDHIKKQPFFRCREQMEVPVVFASDTTPSENGEGMFVPKPHDIVV